MLAAGRNLTAEAVQPVFMAGVDDEEAGRLYAQTGGVADRGAGYTMLRACSTGATTGGSFTLDANSITDFGKLTCRSWKRRLHPRNAATCAPRPAISIYAAGNTLTSRAVKFVADGGSGNIGGSIVAQSDNQRAKSHRSVRHAGRAASGLVVAARGRGFWASRRSRRHRDSRHRRPAARPTCSQGSFILTHGVAEHGRVAATALALGLDTPADPLDDDTSPPRTPARHSGDVSAVTIAPVLVFDASTPSWTRCVPGLRGPGPPGRGPGAPRFQKSIRRGQRQPVPHLPSGRRAAQHRRHRDREHRSVGLALCRITATSPPNSARPPKRAASSINITGNISDGFARNTDGVNDLMSGGSATLRFTAGAQLGSADSGCDCARRVGRPHRRRRDRRRHRAHRHRRHPDGGRARPEDSRPDRRADRLERIRWGLAGVPADQLQNNRQVIWLLTQGG